MSCVALTVKDEKCTGKAVHEGKFCGHHKGWTMEGHISSMAGKRFAAKKAAEAAAVASASANGEWDRMSAEEKKVWITAFEAEDKAKEEAKAKKLSEKAEADGKKAQKFLKQMASTTPEQRALVAAFLSAATPAPAPQAVVASP